MTAQCSNTIDTGSSRAHRIIHAAMKSFAKVVYTSPTFILCNILKILPNSENLKEYLYGLLRRV